MSNKQGAAFMRQKSLFDFLNVRNATKAARDQVHFEPKPPANCCPPFSPVTGRDHGNACAGCHKTGSRDFQPHSSCSWSDETLALGRSQNDTQIAQTLAES